MVNILFGSISDSTEWIYHYTSMETALEHILNSGKIRLTSYLNTNDPRESKNWFFSMSSDDAVSSKYFFDTQKKCTDYVKNKCKVLCMVQDDSRAIARGPDHIFHRGFSRPRMWAQYSNNHSGVCIIFDRSSLEQQIKHQLSSRGDIYFGEIQYSNIHQDEVDAFHVDNTEIINSSLEEYLNQKVKKFHKNYFFTKAEDWSAENEWRCVIRGNTTSPEYVSIAKSIRGIIIGSEFPSVYEPSLIPFSQQYSVSIGRCMWHNGRPIIIPGPDSNA